jgi:hypothetical protein
MTLIHCSLRYSLDIADSRPVAEVDLLAIPRVGEIVITHPSIQGKQYRVKEVAYVSKQNALPAEMVFVVDEV